MVWPMLSFASSLMHCDFDLLGFLSSVVNFTEIPAPLLLFLVS